MGKVKAGWLLLLGVLCLPPTPSSAQTVTAASAAATAARVGEELSRRSFGLSTHDWQKAAASAVWVQFTGQTFRVPPLGGLWCSRASDRRGEIRRQAVFYAFRTEAPLACRLEELRYELELPAPQLAAMYQACLRELAVRFGTLNAHENRPYGHPPPAIEDGPAREPLRWSGDTSSVFLYRTANTVVVLARHHVLEQYSRHYALPMRRATHWAMRR